MMTLSQVEAFRSVVLSGSTTAAARILHTSQPNVSRLISQLEKSIGLRLFERFPGKLIPTEEGLAFFDEVQRSFIGLEQLGETAGKIRRFGTDLLRIAAVPTLALGLLPRAVKRFARDYPEVGLSLHMGHSSIISQWVDSRYCDLGVVSQLSRPDLSVDPVILFQVDGVCMMPAGHRLAKKDRITPEDLDGENFISLAKHDELRKGIDRIFDGTGIKRKIYIETPYSSIICALVTQGMGVCVVNPLVAQEYRSAGVVIRPFSPAPRFEGLLVFPKGRPASRLVQGFTQALRDVAQEECEALLGV